MSDSQLVATLIAKPTIANAFRAWLPHAENSLSTDEHTSAKNFARAFQIWYDKSNKPDSTETVFLSGVSIAGETELFMDEFSLMTDPIAHHLDPKSKTTHFGKNARLITTFLASPHAGAVIGPDELKHALETCAYMELEVPRIERATWVLFQHEVAFHPALGSQPRRVELDEGVEPVDALYEVLVIGGNWVIAERQSIGDDDTSGPSFPEDPIKIQVPPVVASILRVGDGLQVGIQKVKDADYWVIISVSAIESGNRRLEDDDVDALTTDLAQSTLSSSSSRVKSSSYQDRLTKLQEDDTPLLPDDGFDNEIYTEGWFKARELDLASDENIETIWDYDDDDEEEEEEDGEEDEDDTSSEASEEL